MAESIQIIMDRKKHELPVVDYVNWLERELIGALGAENCCICFKCSAVWDEHSHDGRCIEINSVCSDCWHVREAG